MHSSLISFSESGLVNAVGQRINVPKPYLRINRTSNSIILEFEMDKQESILIFCKREKEEHFVFLGEAEKSPFIDERPNLSKYSENRQYKAVFALDGAPVGEEDLIDIKTKGRFRFF
jgi:hypothetical protein